MRPGSHGLQRNLHGLTNSVADPRAGLHRAPTMPYTQGPVIEPIALMLVISPPWIMKRDLVELVEHSFGSVWALELLLLLYRNTGRIWHRKDLVLELRSSELVVEESIARLLSSALVTDNSDGTLAFAPASDELRALVRDLDEEYRTRPAAIRRLIIQSPTDRLNTFSDAFRLREK
jgi:hypothetical protein